MMPMAGTVYLVGAGPGDPGLLTRRGARLLRTADVILYDRLVSRALLALARPEADRIPVGKRPGGMGITQADIHERLISAARRGQVVVRLKGGDPFVFGRGSEEREACLRAGVPCVVVPGVTSAIAGPGAMGIPVTARGVARSFVVLSGHNADDGGGRADGEEECDGDWGRPDTVVVLMGRQSLPAVTARLKKLGYGPDTGAALVDRATMRSQRGVRASLGTIAAAADRAGIETPAVLVVGDVVEQSVTGPLLPLAGARVMVTRPHHASTVLAEHLRARGAEVIVGPAIGITYMEPDVGALPPVSWDWVVFTSRHAVRGWWRWLARHNLDARVVAGSRVAAVGPSTAGELRRIGLRADLIPTEFRAAALVKTLAPHLDRGSQVLHPCGTRARAEVREGLQHAAEVHDLVVYATCDRAPGPSLRRRVAQGVDYLLLHSPSAAQVMVTHRLVPPEAVIACIGPTTAAAAQSLGLSPLIVAEEHTDRGLVAALERHAGGDRS